ncbi:unnamed protein product [Trichogramma brassicae]|uniref:Uncharacterized protein n=1 Tax=Trichogramma brassicae TaxID=86971 RepID=A0A6H5IW45_9HYME|nr:unnamed protein product [Trichogramma brassicae]
MINCVKYFAKDVKTEKKEPEVITINKIDSQEACGFCRQPGHAINNCMNFWSTQNEDARDEDARTAAVKSYSEEEDDAYESAEETKTRAAHPVEVVFKEITNPGIMFHRLGEVKQEENIAVVSVIDLPKRENPRYDNNAEWLDTVAKDPIVAKSIHGRILWKWQRNQLFLIPSTSTEGSLPYDEFFRYLHEEAKAQYNGSNISMSESTAFIRNIIHHNFTREERESATDSL